MKALAALLAGAALLYAFICLAFYFGQRSFVYFPVAGRDASVPAITLRRDGVGLVVSTHASTSPRAIVYFGGNAEDVSRALPGLREAFPDAAVYALHYRGYGGSGGRPSEAALVGDGAALMAHADARHREIVLVGRSLGSGVAVQVATRHPPAQLVLVTPFDGMDALAARHYPWLPVRLILRERYPSATHARAIRVPTTLVVAARDALVPPAHAQALQDAFAPGIAHSVVLDGAGHNDVDAHPGYLAALRGGPGVD